MDGLTPSVRETISRWAQDTQELLEGLLRLLDAHEQIVAEARSLEARAREAERRAQDRDQRSAKLTQDAAVMRQQIEELGSERVRLERALAQVTEQAQAPVQLAAPAQPVERPAARPMMPPPPAATRERAVMPPPSIATRERPAIERIRFAPDIATAAASSAAPSVPAAVAPIPAAPAPAAAEPSAPTRLVSPRAATGPRRPHAIRFSAAMLDEPGTASGAGS